MTLIALVSIAILATFFEATAPSLFGSTDFIQYWGGGQLLLQGISPYGGDSLYSLERALSVKELITLWNPPWILPLLAPLALFSFKNAVWVWAGAQCLLYITSLLMLQSVLPASRANSTVRLLSWLTALSSYPMALALWYGQISVVLLFGIAIFLVYAQRGDWPQVLAAGSGLALTTIKPHALLPLYIYLAIIGVRTKRLAVLMIAALVIALLSFAALLAVPSVFDSYIGLMQSPPLWWKTPSLGSWVQELLNQPTVQGSLFMRSIPQIIAISMIGIIALVLKNPYWLKLDVIVLLIPISLFVSPYSWLYDQILLLPSMLWIIARCWQDSRRRWLCFIPMALNILVGIDPTPGQEYYVWYPLVMTLAVLAAGKVKLGEVLNG